MNNAYLSNGIGFAALALIGAGGNVSHARKTCDVYRDTWGEAALPFLKAAVDPGTLEGWGAGLVPEPVVVFIDQALRESLLRIPGFVQAPANARLVEAADGGDAYWVSDSALKPATMLQLVNKAGLSPTKVAALVAITDELAHAGDAGAPYITRALQIACVKAIDIAFTDPTNKGDPGRKPAAITYGASDIASTGDFGADIVTALGMLPNPRAVVGILNTLDAAGLAAKTKIGTGSLYPSLAINGGTLGGIPVYTSDYAPSGKLILVNTSRVAVWTSALDVRYSDQAIVRLDDAATQATAPVSMWQENLHGILVEQGASWQAADFSVAVVELPT